MIHELYQKAGILHGHYCPGLAMGVRAAAEALRILDVTPGQKGLFCIAECSACYLDGIQMIFGATMGNRSLEVRPTGITAFNFYDTKAGTSVRLTAVTADTSGMTREEKTERILTAPLAEVFKVTEARFPAPAGKYIRYPERACSRCGESVSEPFLRVAGEELLCPHCEKSARG